MIKTFSTANKAFYLNCICKFANTFEPWDYAFQILFYQIKVLQSHLSRCEGGVEDAGGDGEDGGGGDEQEKQDPEHAAGDAALHHRDHHPLDRHQ